MEEWNRIVAATLAELHQPGAHGLDAGMPRQRVDLASKALVTAGGAVLPRPRCADFLKANVYKTEIVLPGRRETVEVFTTQQGGKFRTRDFFHVEKAGTTSSFQCGHFQSASFFGFHTTISLGSGSPSSSWMSPSLTRRCFLLLLFLFCHPPMPLTFQFVS